MGAMKIVILGSGVLGVTTAYVLASRGHRVEVIERQPESGLETSFANGGQLSYSHAEPWATPHILKVLPGWLLKPDSPLIFRLRADVDMFRWGLEFLRNCTPARAEANCLTLLRLGLYSHLKLAQIVADTGIEFDHSARGILHIFNDHASWDHAKRQADFQAKHGCEENAISAEQVLAMEPTLASSERKIIGGMHAPLDAQADTLLYCKALASYCTEKLGVKFHYNTTITALEKTDDAVTAVKTDKGDFNADAYVLALGSYSPLFSKKLGFRLPIYPMKGYSVTLPFNDASPRISVTDGTHKIVVTKLGNFARIAGTAELAGYDTNINNQRIKPIVRAAKSLFPHMAWEQEQTFWACLRPSTPNGPPVLGASPVRNVFLNTGHGTLGWTQAAGSAYLLADVIEKRATEISLQGLTLKGTL